MQIYKGELASGSASRPEGNSYAPERMMDLHQSDTRCKIHDPGEEICSFVEKKLALFERYLSITKKIKDTFYDKEANNIGAFLSERQNCIHKIQKIDLSVAMVIKAGSDEINHISHKLKKMIDSYVEKVKQIMDSVGLIDKELLVMVKEEGDSVKRDLLKMRNVRQAARGYRTETRYSPRFLDQRR